MSNKVRMATQRLIDSVWTIVFIVVNGKAEIIRYSRDIQEGYDNERDLMQGKLVEDSNRTVTGLRLKPYEPFNNFVNKDNATETYEVSNPKYIFDYQEQKTLRS